MFFGKDKLDIWFYVRRLIKSKTPAEFIKNQSDASWFINNRMLYEYRKLLKH